MVDGKKAVDIYYDDSFVVNYLMDQKKGIYERPNGGLKIKIPFEYDEQEGGFYSKGQTISSDERDTLNAAYFDLANRSFHAEVSLSA